MGSTFQPTHYHINSWSGRSIKKLREEHLKIQLTISLHAATQSARNRIIPHMRIYAIEELLSKPYPILKGIIAKLSLRIAFTGYK